MMSAVYLLATHEAMGKQEAHCVLRQLCTSAAGEHPESSLDVRDRINGVLRCGQQQDFPEELARTLWKSTDPKIKSLLSDDSAVTGHAEESL